MSFFGDLWDNTGGKVVSYVDDAWDATNERGDDSYLERFLDTAGSIGSDIWNYDVPHLSTETSVNPITWARDGLNFLGDAMRPFTPDAFEEWMDNFESGSPIVQWPDQYLIQPLERIVDTVVSPHEQEWVQDLAGWANENILGQPPSVIEETEKELAYSDIDPSRKRERAANEREKARLRREAEEREVRTGPSWDPNGLTNLLQDQIAFINELTAAGILNVEDARAATGQRLDEVWGELQAGFQSELDDLVAGDAAAAASLGATTESLAADLADMGVDAAVLDPERRAMEEMMAMQAANEMNFAEGLRDSAAFGQADRLSSMNFGMDDLILGLEMGQLQQTGQLENMADMAQIQGSAMNVDPMLVFADMLSGTNVAQQMMASNASAAASADMTAAAEYLAAHVPDFGGDPNLAAMVLNGMLPGNYFKPENQSFLDSLQGTGIIGALGEEIQAIMQNNQNISFQDATRIAVDALSNLGE